MVLYVKEEMKRNDLPEPAVIGLLWTCIMNAVEWNKKEELVAEQALKHLKVCLGDSCAWTQYPLCVLHERGSFCMEKAASMRIGLAWGQAA